ncbi:ABC transporter substrate-binding protein [Bradyrhizobium sp.]|uniref:ABC transporter substrate-binding protein n=1 Tax=Bradyrhizobium sp. TaxID=376 RepID=UPI0039E42611
MRSESMRPEVAVRHSRRSLLLGTAAVAISGALGPARADTGPTKIVVSAVQSITSSPHFVAKEKGYFTEQSLDVTVDTSLQNVADQLPLLAAGKYQVMATSWGASVFNAMRRGGLIRVLGTQTTLPESGRNLVALVVSKANYDAGLTTAAGLKGKKVGVVGLGGWNEYDVHLALKAFGGSVKDVELVQIGRNDIGPAVANGAITASWAAEPGVTLLEEKGIAVPIANDAARGKGAFPLLANGDFSKQNPDACARYLAAFLKAAREIEASAWQDPQIVEIVSKYTGVPADILRRTPSKLLPKIEPDFALMDDMQEYFRERKMLTYTDKINFADFYSPQIIEQARKLAK